VQLHAWQVIQTAKKFGCLFLGEWQGLAARKLACSLSAGNAGKGGMMNNRTLSNRLLIFGIVLLLLAACGQPAHPPTPSVPGTVKLVKGFAAAWDAGDADQLLSYYSQDVKSYDATSGGVFYGYSTVDDVLHHDWINGSFIVNIASFFVSHDGRFAATVGTFSQKDSSGQVVPTPYVSLVEVSGKKLVWIYDYYGGVSAKGLPLQKIPASASQPDPSNQVVIGTRALVTAWEAAYNGKDSAAFLSSYADAAKVTQVISPEWRIFTKNTLEQEITSQFASVKFVSQLSDFFVSADGHFVAVQGTYDDAKTMDTPMVIILEVKDGKIVEEYDYMVYKEVF
jgi:ketosteroid isomerase-like protein